VKATLVKPALAHPRIRYAGPIRERTLGRTHRPERTWHMLQRLSPARP